MLKRVERDEARRLIEEERAQLIEVLPREDYDALHIAGASNLPLKELDARAENELDRKRPIIVYCNDFL